MIILPIGHDQTIRRFPFTTVGVMVVCVCVWLLQLALAPRTDALERASKDRDVAAERVEEKYGPGVTPDPTDPIVVDLREADARIQALQKQDLARRFGARGDDPFSAGLVLSAFLHGGLFHLAGNVLFLWLCGCNLEDRWGKLAFSGLYLASAFVAALSYVLLHRGESTPMIGASGAIAGLMGAFVVCYHSAQIKLWWWWRFRSGTFYTPAWVAFPFWFVEQAGQLFFEAHGFGGVAYSAHVGGFLFGVAVAATLRATGYDARLREASGHADDDTSDAMDPQPLQYPVVTLKSARPMPSLRPPPPDIAFPAAPSTFPRARPAPVKSPTAAIALAHDDPRSAIPHMRAALAKAEHRDDLRYELLLAALSCHEREAVEETITRSLIWLGEHERWVDAVTIWHALRQDFADLRLSDRALSILVRATCELREARECVRAATLMQQWHPKSPLLPRALWDVSIVQRDAGRADLASKTLQRIVDEHPEHTFAAEAKALLARETQS